MEYIFFDIEHFNVTSLPPCWRAKSPLGNKIYFHTKLHMATVETHVKLYSRESSQINQFLFLSFFLSFFVLFCFVLFCFFICFRSLVRALDCLFCLFVGGGGSEDGRFFAQNLWRLGTTECLRIFICRFTSLLRFRKITVWHTRIARQRWGKYGEQ